MQYRLYRPDDFASLWAIEEVCFQPPLRFGRRYMRSLLESERAATWIAEEDGAMAGFAIVDWERHAGIVYAYLQTIEVRPEWRQRGAGVELLRRAEGSAKVAGAAWIWLHVDEKNHMAIRLYQAHGFSLQGREEDYYARGRAALVYARRLDAALEGAD